MVRVVVLLVFVCQVAVAQDQPAAATQPSPDGRFGSRSAELQKAETLPEAAGTNTEVTEAEWKPKLAITLTTAPHGQNVVRSIVRSVPLYRTAYEEIERVVDNETVKVRVAVQKLGYREVAEQMIVPGKAIVLCDGLDMTVEATDSAPKYSFTSKGPMILQYQTSVIRAESGTYKNGELTLTKASVTQAGLTMDSESLTVKLTIYGMTTAPQSSPTGPRQDDSFNDFRRPPVQDEGFRDSRTLDRRDDSWNPQSDPRGFSSPDSGLERSYDLGSSPLRRDQLDGQTFEPQTQDREDWLPQPNQRNVDRPEFEPQKPSKRDDVPAPTRYESNKK